MIRELLLLRHGKAAAQDPRGDFHRELKTRGKRAAQRIAVWLARHDILPDRVLSSGASRALNTAHKCCKAMGLPGSAVLADNDLYLASPQTLLQRLHQVPADARRVMLVGHNPGLEQLLLHLCRSAPPLPPDSNLLPTAALARLAFDGDWGTLRPGQSELLDLQHSDSLPEDFPWPDAHGSQRRQRPAYYYTQSSAIPYRVNDGRLQVMLVRSSGDRHWVVPKGIADPGMSAQDSALKEAREEAGIEGGIVGTSLGRYRYAKWGAECEVEVFAMRVDRELPPESWPEDHRGRRWVSADVAALLLAQRALAPMIERLAARLAEAACRA